MEVNVSDVRSIAINTLGPDLFSGRGLQGS